MATRDNVIDVVAAHLHERYERSLKIQREIERLNSAGDNAAVQLILATPSYREDSKSRFGFKEIAEAVVPSVTYSSLYYTLLTAPKNDLKNKRQVDAFLERGIAIDYKNATATTKVKFFYDPGVLYQAAMAHYAPPEVIIQPYQPPTINRDVVEIKYEASVGPEVKPTGSNPEHVCPPECPEPKDHDNMATLQRTMQILIDSGMPAFEGKDWKGAWGVVANNLLNTIKEFKAREQTPEN